MEQLTIPGCKEVEVKVYKYKVWELGSFGSPTVYETHTLRELDAVEYIASSWEKNASKGLGHKEDPEQSTIIVESIDTGKQWKVHTISKIVAYRIINGEPCIMCAKLIHHAGIETVIVVNGVYENHGLQYLKDYGVDVLFETSND